MPLTLLHVQRPVAKDSQRQGKPQEQQQPTPDSHLAPANRFTPDKQEELACHNRPPAPWIIDAFLHGDDQPRT
jgi:hypothetical protein